MTWTIRPRFKTEDGIAGYTCGQGPNMVLIHGVGLRAESWNGVADVLAEYFTVHAIDMPGHGESDSLPAGANLADYTDSVVGFLKKFDRPVGVAGHSMGALITMDMAVRYPQYVRKAAALNCIYKRSPKAAVAVKARADHLSQNLETPLTTDVTLKRWFGEVPEGEAQFAAQACHQWLQDTKIEEYAAAYQIFAQSDGPLDAGLDVLSVPALFLTGGDEPNSTPAMSRALAKRVHGGQAKVIEGAAHMVIMTHAVETAKALNDFFAAKGI